MEDVPDLENVQKLDAQKLNKNELKLATTLVQEMATTLAEIDTEDNYYTALRTLIDSKIKGREIAEFEVEEVPRLDIMSALKKSLQASSRKPMVKTIESHNEPNLVLSFLCLLVALQKIFRGQ
jgi:non-homologous end joining protein Ku